jgi:hypothetical protein
VINLDQLRFLLKSEHFYFTKKTKIFSNSFAQVIIDPIKGLCLSDMVRYEENAFA